MGSDNDTKLFLDAVRGAAGEDGVLAVQRTKGGMEVSLPRKPRAEHWLCAALGREAAESVCRAMWVIDTDGHVIGGLRVYVPSGTVSLIGRAKAEAERLLREGETITTVWLRIGLSHRTIRRIAHKVRPEREL